MKKFSVLFATLVMAFFIWSCGSDVESDDNDHTIHIEIDTDSDELRDDLEDGLDDLQDGLDDMSEGLQEGLDEMTSGLSKMLQNIKIEVDGDGTEAVDFRELKALLPDHLMGMKRTSHTGERSGIKGLQVSVAKAEYEDDDRRLEISIVDGGSFPIANIAQAGWSMVDVDKEDKNGYERTTTIDGQKAFEKYNEKWEEGELAILIDDRFIVSIKGKGINEDDLQRALKRLDLVDELTDARFAR